MKVYRHWVLATGTVPTKDGERQIRCYGGSDRSPAEASARAREKIEAVRRRVAGDRHVFDDYEVEIREEVLEVLGPGAVVTRNRYGARVLNAESLMILDLDRPPFSFWDLFGGSRDPKGRIVRRVKALAGKPSYRELGFRIYETSKGVRVIVLGRAFDPRAPETAAMMREFHCDPLYRVLCAKQGCFRARLTPKAGRMRVRGIRLRCPGDEAQARALKAWLGEYEAASRRFDVCRFLEQVGPGAPPAEVLFHDEATGAHRGLRLA